MKFRHLILALISFTLLAQCVKVSELDDSADISSCGIASVSPQAVVFNIPVVEGDQIILPMDYGKYEFPVTVTLDIKTAQKIDKILGIDADNSLVFENEGTVRKIHLIALSGVVHTYEIHIEVAPRSDLASVSAAMLQGFTPDDFLLAREVVIDLVENQVVIYALKGQTLPLNVSMQMELSPGAHLDDQQPVQTFAINTYDTAIPFTVTAESGKKETWSVILTGITPVEDLSQTQPEVWERMAPAGPYDVSFQNEGPVIESIRADASAGKIIVCVREQGTAFPWNVSLNYGLQPYILPIHIAPGDIFPVAGWEDTRTFYLMDMLSLQARAWDLIWERWLNPDNKVLSFAVLEYNSAQNLMELGDSVIDTLIGYVSIPMISGNDFPLEITSYNITVSDSASYRIPGQLLFESYKSEIPFIVTSQSGIEKEWVMKMDPWFSTGTDVLSFTAESYHSEQNMVQLESRRADIDNDNKILTLVLRAGYDFPLVIDSFGLELSENAVIQEDYSQGIVFNTISQTVPLTVVAESGDTMQWTLVLADERTENLEALVLDYHIAGYRGTTETANNILMEEWGVVDTLNRTVSLIINDWSSKMPLTVNGVMNISKNAILEGTVVNTCEHQVVFHTAEETFEFAVTSESRTNTTVWTLMLEDRSPVRSSVADVTGFVTGNPSSGFVFDQKYLESGPGIITLLVRERPSPDALLAIKPQISVSPGARLQGITSGAPLALSFAEPYVFRVMAQDETVKEWQVQLIYAPQVYNSGYEDWGTVEGIQNILPSNGNGWTTGNNAQVIGTTKVSGKDSPYAAEMLTQLKSVNLVVIKVTSLAAGAVMLGQFNFSMDVEAVMNPTSMSDFGIPFMTDTNPIGFEIDYKYQSGGQRVYTQAYKGAFGMPAFKDPVNVAGPDKAVIATELHYNQGGEWVYDLKNRPTLIAESEILTEGTPGWTRARIVFDKVPGKENLKMTHLVVRMSSSYQGDEFKGADGSKLTVDNFKLIYYLPGDTAVILE
ncbi:MAG: PCMD domain-containing protein [Bacteroidales bacterium]|jgi:hypothetical protein